MGVRLSRISVILCSTLLAAWASAFQPWFARSIFPRSRPPICAAGWYYHAWWGLIGLVPIVTAAIGWCPAYMPLGLSTKKE